MPEIFSEHPNLENWLRARHLFRGQKKLRAALVWAIEHEVSLPPGQLKEAAKIYRQRIEDSIIPVGKV